MKVARFSRTRPVLTASELFGSVTAGPDGQVITSIGSNTVSWGSNISDIFVNGTDHVLGPYINFADGSNTTITVDKVASIPSNTIRIHASVAGGSFGSNSTRVSEVSSAGASTDSSRADHIHDGIGTITSSSSNTMQRGTWNIRPGAGIALSLTDTDGDGEFDTTTIVNTASGGGGGGGGAPTTAKYVTTAADGSLSAEVVRPQLGNYFAETYPTSANATYDDEFDDSSGMSGTGNGLNARWSWRNQSTSTATYGTAGWLTMSIPSSGSANYRIIENSNFADGTYDALIAVEARETTGDGGGGIVLVDGTNGDLYVFVLVDVSGVTGLYLQRWNSVSSFNSSVASITTLQTTRLFLRIVKSGTTIDAWWSDSGDGIGFRRLATFTDAVSATRIGLGAYETKSTGATKLHVDYFRKTA